MINKYPYTDFHELNLDWFLEEFKKVTDKVTDLDTTVQQFTDFVTNYFDNLDVQQEINNKLNQMAADGTLSNLLKPFVDELVVITNNELLALQDDVNVLSARVDSFEQLAEGSTTGDAELIDARIGADGVTYDTAGDAIRAQIGDITRVLRIETVTSAYQGGVNTSGNLIVATNRIRTQRLQKGETNHIYAIRAIPTYSFCVFVYQAGVYSGILQDDGSITATPNWYDNLILRSEYDEIIIVMRHDDDSDLTPDEMTSFTFLRITDELSRQDLIAALESTDGLTLFEYVLTDFEKMNGGAIDSSGNLTTNLNYYTSSIRTNRYIPLNGATQVYAKSVCAAQPDGPFTYVFFYDASLSYLGRVGGSGLEVTAPVISGAAYFMVSFTLHKRVGGVDDPTNIKSFVIGAGQPTAISNPGKWYVFGDSVSAGYFSMTDAEATLGGYTIVYRPSDLGYPVYGVGSAWLPDLSHNYWGYANRWFLKKDLQPNAYPGQGFLRKAANTENAIDVINRVDFSDAELITVAWGFNDWHYNLTRGDHTPPQAQPDSLFDPSTITTINQAIWYVLGMITYMAPKAKVVVQTPMNGWLYGGDFSTDWGLGYTLSNSGTLADIHDDIVYWAEYYGLQLLDMTYGNSIVNRVNIKTALVDGSHPTDDAHMQLGRYVAIALKHI